MERRKIFKVWSGPGKGSDMSLVTLLRELERWPEEKFLLGPKGFYRILINEETMDLDFVPENPDSLGSIVNWYDLAQKEKRGPKTPVYNITRSIREEAALRFGYSPKDYKVLIRR